MYTEFWVILWVYVRLVYKRLNIIVGYPVLWLICHMPGVPPDLWAETKTALRKMWDKGGLY